MKLNVSHPKEQSLQLVTQASDEGEILHRSPHVGNVNNQELGLLFGLSALGVELQLELVDTIRGNDSYSQPRIASVGLKKIVLASNKHAAKIVGSCQVQPQGVDELNRLGIETDSAAKTLKDIHVGSLKAVIPENVSITPSSESFAQLDRLVYETILRETQKVISRPMRSVTETGKIEEINDTSDFKTIYGLDGALGVLPPLEAMMAIEIIKKVIENKGEDQQTIHVGGKDMVKYTREDVLMQTVEDIVSRTLSDFGVSNNITFDYIVPGIGDILSSEQFNPVIEESMSTQYDILMQQQLTGEKI